MENKILANVGGIAVTNQEIDEFIANLGQRGQAYNTPEGRAAILNQLVANKLLLLEARKNLYEMEPEFKAQLVLDLTVSHHRMMVVNIPHIVIQYLMCFLKAV